MKIKINESQLQFLTEGMVMTTMSQEKFHKFFAFIFNKISKLNDYNFIKSYNEYLEKVTRYDKKYLYKLFFYDLYNFNIKKGLDWYTSKLQVHEIGYGVDITFLPNNLTILNGDLDLSYSALQHLPDNLNVLYGGIYVNNSSIKTIGNNITTHVLNAKGNAFLTKLGDNITTRDYFDVSNTNVSIIPNNLNIGGDFRVFNSGLSLEYSKKRIISTIKEKGGHINGKVRGAKEYESDENITVWQSRNPLSTYAFSNTKTDRLAVKFTDYIKNQNEKNEPATRKDFLTKFYPTEVKPGYLSTFFASIKDAGIVNLNNKNEYTLGKNYEDFLKGKMRKQKYDNF